MFVQGFPKKGQQKLHSAPVTPCRLRAPEVTMYALLGSSLPSRFSKYATVSVYIGNLYIFILFILSYLKHLYLALAHIAGQEEIEVGKYEGEM